MKIEVDFAYINTCDGPNYQLDSSKVFPVTCYSLQLYGEAMRKTLGPASSYNLLSYKMVDAPEKLEYVLPSVQDNYNQLSEAFNNAKNIIPGCHLHFYEMHDGKMLYLLTQHLLWNRKKYPFLWCGCSRGDGFNNKNHKCRMHTDVEELQLYNRAKKMGREKKS